MSASINTEEQAVGLSGEISSGLESLGHIANDLHPRDRIALVKNIGLLVAKYDRRTTHSSQREHPVEYLGSQYKNYRNVGDALVYRSGGFHPIRWLSNFLYDLYHPLNR